MSPFALTVLSQQYHILLGFFTLILLDYILNMIFVHSYRTEIKIVILVIIVLLLNHHR